MAAFDGLDAAEVFRTSRMETLNQGEGPPDAFRLPERAGVAVEPLKAQGRNARAPGASCRRWAPTPATPTSACATPMRSRIGMRPTCRAAA